MAFSSVVVPLWALFALVYGPAPAAAVTLTYCSSENTGASFDPKSSIFQSNGLCQQTCTADYAFAIILGEKCWCSNYAPGSTTSTSNCNSPCPGYPSDHCGNTSDNLYAYIQLSNHEPSGTAGATSTGTTATTDTPAQGSTTTNSMPEASTVTVTATPESSMTSSSTSTTAPTTSAPTTTAPIVSVQTVAGQPVTITVVNPASPTSTAAASSDSHGSGLSGGAIAGIVIGSLLGVGALVAFGLWLWFFGRRRDSRNVASPDSRYDTLLDNRRQSKASQMSLMRGWFSPHSEKSSSPDHMSPAPAPTFTDSRMKQDAVLYPSGSRHSTVSLQDDQDYSRPVLRLTNPD
ncbi:ER membrane protein Wsc4 [Rasamsonia emersonii CBS 393.64]|uniref:ER membrane protein Wsc4 n=1 Tax=Rasamsonia emersonii (strain ATCC 16479 / CBS 393.64 / IMI 116815) TaxID=1408163 RepID=A0A0F4YQE2_RASE3|nr:ER membrane protein Wsc4 [Rasamsonia emersonii CBS 393.64]KKA19833.1 ER membrane protein Wsc4 [Rasamsonia emersonii CBS 393.64]